jgi:hypothetical protein
VAAGRLVGAPIVSGDPGGLAVATHTSRWQRIPIGWRVVIVVAGGALLLNLFARFVSASTGGDHTPSGRTSSSYGTQSDGLAAYADLLRAEGHPVARTRRPLESSTLDPATTVVVLDPDTVAANDAGVLLTFVVNGGRLVVGGAFPDYFGALRDDPPQWVSGAPTTWTGVSPALAPIGKVVSAGDGRFDTAGASTPLVSDAGGEALVTEADVGRGTIAFVADASPLQNRLLGTADNAALGLALAGPASRPVVFPESVHGYGPARGLGAIPTDWKIALGGLAIAGLVLMWARGRRLGPPEDASRPLPPPRAAYVDAVGSTLRRARRPDEALAPVARHVRATIDARATFGADGPAGETGDLDPAEFARRAHALGLTDDELAALDAPVTDETVLALGRALHRAVQATRRDGQ